jgi:hypothetical protein
MTFFILLFIIIMVVMVYYTITHKKHWNDTTRGHNNYQKQYGIEMNAKHRKKQNDKYRNKAHQYHPKVLRPLPDPFGSKLIPHFG